MPAGIAAVTVGSSPLLAVHLPGWGKIARAK
jgi:hypothetical protein